MYGKPVDSIGFVGQFDPELAAMMGRELTRQQDGLELIASENFASPAVIAAMGSILTNKYARACPESATTAAASSWMKSKAYAPSGQRPASVRSSPTFSPIPVRRPIWPSSWRCCSPVIP